MVPYFIMVGVPAVLAFYNSQIRKKTFSKHNIVIDSFFFIWLLLLLFRSIEVGCDLPVYQYHFQNYAQMSWLQILDKVWREGSELSYIAISKILSYFTGNFQWIMISCACISVIPIWKLYRNEKYFGFLIVVLFINIAPFSMYFSGLRQAMAMAFVAPCYRYCKEKNIKKYLLMILLAYLFHRSALVLLLMYPTYHMRLKTQLHMFYLLPAVGLVYVFNMPIFHFIMLFMGDYAEEYADGIKTTGAYAVLLLLAVLLVYSFLIPDPNKLDDDTVGLRNLLILCVFLQTFSGVHSIAMRMNYYYLLFIPILIPRIIVCGNPKYRTLIKVSIVCMILFFTVYYFYKAYTGSDILEVYPYKSFFQDL